jgi:replication-associated recombination protein RarA
MCRLSEKYAPKTLSEVVGQPEAVRALQAFCKAPEAAGFLFVGDGGIGKSSLIRALSNDLGISEWDTHRYSGPKLTKEATEELFDRKLRFRPMYGKFVLLVVEEFEACASKEVRMLLKDYLSEGQWPRHLIVLISSNYIGKLEPALLQRFAVYHLRSDDDLGILALPWLKEVYAKECAERGITPDPKGLCNGSRIYAGGYVKPTDLLDGQKPRYSIRAALTAMEKMLSYQGL